MVRPMSAAAVIFDLDGTLADTLADIAAALDRVLAAAGLPTHPMEAYRAFVGSGARVLVENALGGAHRDRVDEILAAFLDDYLDNLVVASAPYPGIDELLEGLAALPVAPRLAVLSNKPHHATERVVEALFPSRPFARIYGHRSDWPKKPDPSAALALAAEIGARPERCVFVGDTAVDIQTAVRAGMRAVGCLWGFRDRAELERAGADVVLAHPRELLAVVKAMGA